jgi:hypothetical protein
MEISVVLLRILLILIYYFLEHELLNIVIAHYLKTEIL